jgi:hypothetical protein
MQQPLQGQRVAEIKRSKRPMTEILGMCCCVLWENEISSPIFIIL